MSADTLSMEETAFDTLASDYDATFTRTRLAECLRAMVWNHLDESLPPAGRILEIGCGTGEDAVRLAARGYEVCATDASARMIEEARKKAGQSGCQGSIEFREVPMERLVSELDGQFDAVFSNFGVLNCAQDIAQLMRGIASLTREGAPLLGVIMGRYVPWEWVWFMARLKWRKALRRVSRDGTPWRGMRIRYPTTRATKRSLEPYFADIRVSPLGFVLPPSYASSWLEHRPRALRVLARCERVVHRCGALADFSDHYIFDARRNAVQPNG